MLSDNPPQSIHPPGTAPECRARHLTIMLQRIARLPREDQDAIRRVISPQTLAKIHTGTALAWVPMRHNVEIVHAISKQLGPIRAREFFRTFQEQAFNSKLMRNFIQGGLRLTGSDPGKALRMIPAGYDLVFRNVGAWDHPDIYDGCGLMTLRRIPAICLDGPIWLESLAGSFHSILGLLDQTGTVELADMDPGRARAQLRMTWHGTTQTFPTRASMP